MIKERHFGQQDAAVSPVIGVMLMLVVTIIIAALVTTFSSGFVGSTTAAPNTYLDVQIHALSGDTKDQYIMTIEHLGGEPINTAELKITTYYSNDNFTGTAVQSTRTAKTITPGDAYTNIGNTENPINVRVPYLADIGVGSPGDAAVNFGAFELLSGSMMTTGTTDGTEAVLGFDPDDAKNGFKIGSKVDVNIVHTPSGTSLFHKEVRVA